MCIAETWVCAAGKCGATRQVRGDTRHAPEAMGGAPTLRGGGRIQASDSILFAPEHCSLLRHRLLHLPARVRR